MRRRSSARRRRLSPHQSSARLCALHSPEPPAPARHRVRSSASESPVNAAATSLLSLSLATGDADEPSVAHLRTPCLPSGRHAASCVGAHHATCQAHRCCRSLCHRVVSWARDAGALRTARPRHGPRKLGPVRVRAHPRCEAEPCPASPRRCQA
jgi:hypothetical protein